MKKLVFFLLAVVFSTSVFSQQLKVVENLYKDENSRYAIDYPREDFNKTLCGLILIELDMPEATFEGDVVYSEYQNGVWWIYMLDGANWLTVKANEYVPLRLEFSPIKIESAATYFMKIEKVQNESLPLVRQYLVIRTEPSDAKIYVDGEYVGQGEVAPFLPVHKEHHYKVEAPLYHSEEGIVRMTADNTTELEVKLEPVDLGYLVSIRTDQVGDSLYVDDNFVGVSPQELYFELGSYQIEARRGMAVMERTLEITDKLRKDETLDVLIEIKEYDFVDLGLSVKWATCNVGASVPEEYGHCYTWGETMFKDEYVLDNCTTCRDTINEISGSATHDVARVNCGKKWRIPTKDEMAELKDRCQWTWTEKNGVKGYEITGPNGNTIFMPAAGNYMGSTRYNAGIGGLYWTATSPTTEKGNAYYLHFDVDRNIISADRYYGLAIRPVID